MWIIWPQSTRRAEDVLQSAHQRAIINDGRNDPSNQLYSLWDSKRCQRNQHVPFVITNVVSIHKRVRGRSFRNLFVKKKCIKTKLYCWYWAHISKKILIEYHVGSLCTRTFAGGHVHVLEKNEEEETLTHVIVELFYLTHLSIFSRFIL